MSNNTRQPGSGVSTPGSTSQTDDRASQQSRRARRRLIQTLAVGGGIASSKLVPGAWSSPVVQSALLPAHAVSSGCTLGNPNPVPIIVAMETEHPLPGGVNAFARRLADVLVSEANAGRDTELEYFLTGCFWIEFPCSSDRGTLYASAEMILGDQTDPYQVIQAPFVSGQNGDLEGYCFKVTLMNGGEYAELRINLDCNDLYDREPIELRPAPSCRPVETDS